MISLVDNIEEFLSKYDEFKKRETDSGFFIYGEINREVNINNKGNLVLIFDLEIYINKDYPNTIPSVREVDEKIPKTFHKLNDGSFCLAAPYLLFSSIKKNPNFIVFFENFILPYLYSYQYNKKYGKMPFGELRHGMQGIIDFYKELFNIQSECLVVKLLMQAKNVYRGHHLCACGSKKRLRKCHGSIILSIKNSIPRQHLLSEIMQIYKYINKEDFAKGYCL
ncbi:hypothetical protein [Candidatus Ruminimicrobiellum ovillum]|uniref:hypothetical protein n=1 Tax=Candidatus Ruminimicrobiellum ovillum TaxID=1947927 RepID=UPI0035593876